MVAPRSSPHVTPEAVVLRSEPFVLFRVPPDDAASVLARVATLDAEFTMITRERDMLTLLVSADGARELGDLTWRSTREPETWRVITFDVALPWDLVGFLAHVTSALAKAGIPLGAVSAFDRDHLFVHDRHAAEALRILKDAVRP